MKLSSAILIALASSAAAAPVAPGESMLEDPTGIVTTPLSHVIDGVMSALNGNFQFTGTRQDLQQGVQGASGLWQGVQQQAQNAQQGQQGQLTPQQQHQQAQQAKQGQQQGGILSGLFNGISGMFNGGNKPSDSPSATNLPFIGGLFQNSGSSSNTGTGSLLGNLFRVGSSTSPKSAAASVKAEGGGASADIAIKVSGFPTELSEQNLRSTLGKLNLGLNEEQTKYTIQLIQTLVAAFFSGKQIPNANDISEFIPNKVPGNLSQDQVKAINNAIYPTLNIVLKNMGTLNGIQDTIAQVLTRGN
ncbi:hypothetical protein A1Q1_03948 [Trichosporon asahii var. asahii CBS 2479]|uniref:Uncharacterized protein n=1 Tax=Trichosporon asahii var. asahii (strain ATCC 90039 / CBS 2479 / JCM 2466 / KCTC 7840 / NBRC 103889/ NCYC 2677 / UAMH 7654) TaxID=1186058 RepID=J6ES09_TRIAS|nr:hypothetical protein A1Q1_03948 [Trichosporon asahii var. asahii CBS 2479]EJT47319.1 hypothetical protein A1Q1_03948 [Trichosporon asahii var. asahii CBS 2479]